MIKNSIALPIATISPGLLLAFNFATSFYTHIYFDWSYIFVAGCTVYFAVLGYEEYIGGRLHAKSTQ
jgi:hypothetical protein